MFLLSCIIIIVVVIILLFLYSFYVFCGTGRFQDVLLDNCEPQALFL